MTHSTLSMLQRNPDDYTKLISKFTVYLTETVHISHTISINEGQYNASKNTGNIEKLRKYIKDKLISEVCKKVTLYYAEAHSEE